MRWITRNWRDIAAIAVLAVMAFAYRDEIRSTFAAGSHVGCALRAW